MCEFANGSVYCVKESGFGSGCPAHAVKCTLVDADDGPWLIEPGKRCMGFVTQPKRFSALRLVLPQKSSVHEIILRLALTECSSLEDLDVFWTRHKNKYKNTLKNINNEKFR